MTEFFKTVLILSLFGFGMTALLLFLKPVTSQKFPARWQYYTWIAVLISMIFPVYKLIPRQEVQRLSVIANQKSNAPEISIGTENNSAEALPSENISSGSTESSEGLPKSTAPAFKTETLRETLSEMMDIFSYIWLTGMFIYILAAILSYCIYLFLKRKNSFLITDNIIFENVRKELGIRRSLKLKMSADISSPMLVGIAFPTVYIPTKNIGDENMRMVFLHELTHYKRKDLIIKWFSLFVNAVHWFNPLAYLLCANISEACEISCDMAVTHNMSETEQKIYMKTILDLSV